jgi:alpha-tubulin suppressor-like RCC1 family protein
MAIKTGNGGDLVSELFLTEQELLDSFVGDSLFNWGYNFYGQLGNNSVTSTSVPIQTVAGGTNWKQASSGTDVVGAVKTDGTLWMWGKNTAAAPFIGDNTIVHRSSPVQTIAGGTNWKMVSVQWGQVTAIKTDGTLWTWGNNQYGSLGDNTSIYKSSPVQTIAGGTNWKYVAQGTSGHAMAIKTDGTLWGWGYNAHGQLGDNTVANKSSPIQTITGGTNWKMVATGYYNTFAIKTDGTLWGWGLNGNGTLGDNTTTNKSSPVQTIAGGTNWKTVAVGTWQVAAIKTDGTLWTWGINGSGQLGTNDTVDRSSPVQTVAGGTNWKQVCASQNYTGAIKTDGTLWMWGLNQFGALGDGTITKRSSPVQTVAGGNNWKQVSVGQETAVAVTSGYVV